MSCDCAINVFHKSEHSRAKIIISVNFLLVATVYLVFLFIKIFTFRALTGVKTSRVNMAPRSVSETN